MPLSEIGGNLRDVSGHLASLASSPELANTLRHMDRSTANIERVTNDMSRQVPPVLDALREAVKEAKTSLTSAETLLSARGNAASAPGSSGLPEMLYEVTRTARLSAPAGPATSSASTR